MNSLIRRNHMQNLEYLESMKQSVVAVQHKIQLKYNPRKKQLFAIFEGKEDRAYYIPRIEIILKDYPYDEIVEEIAYSKNNVIALRERLDWENYDSRQFTFFVDKDLDYWLDKSTPEASNIFVTDYYSVENYCVTSNVFKDFMLNIEGFSIVDHREFERIMNLFNSWKQSFELDMRKAMAIAIVAKINNPDITLSEVKFTEAIYEISFNNDRLFNNIHLDKLRKKLGVDSSEYDQLIEEKIAAIDQNINEYSIHGKWLLTAMGYLAEFFRINALEFAPTLKVEKIKPTSKVNETKLFPIVAQYKILLIPESLNTVVLNNYVQYLIA